MDRPVIAKARAKMSSQLGEMSPLLSSFRFASHTQKVVCSIAPTKLSNAHMGLLGVALSCTL